MGPRGVENVITPQQLMARLVFALRSRDVAERLSLARDVFEL